MPMLKPEKRGDSWRVKVYIGNKKYRSVTGTTKADAIQKAERLQAELLAEKEQKLEKPADPYAELTVAEAMERYVEAKKGTLSPSSYREFTRMRQRDLKPLYEIKLKELTQEQVQTAISLEAASHEPKTVRSMHGFLSSVLKMFRPDFVLHTKLPQNKKSEIVIPTESVVIQLLAAVENTEIDAPTHLAALCGLRMSEILGLRWDKIDFGNRAITICAAKVEGMNREPVLKGTKSTAGERKIKMLPAVEASLLRTREKTDGEFITDLSSRAVYKRYQRILGKICPDEHYTFHELRHYCASVMIMLGIPVKYIADYLGHETEDMVNRVYGHVMNDKKDEMFDRLELYYDKVLPSCPKVAQNKE